MGNSRWLRSKKEPMALREDGVGVALSGGVWTCTTVEVPQERRLKTPGLHAYLDRAIEEADEMYPPPPWKVDAAIWRAQGWCVRSTADGWVVLRIVDGEFAPASSKTFSSSDRARTWADTRFDRAVGGLRGPKPRGGTTAAAKLPDIRVTEEERALAERVLTREGLSYSEFVRAALRWADAHPGEARLA